MSETETKANVASAISAAVERGMSSEATALVAVTAPEELRRAYAQVELPTWEAFCILLGAEPASELVEKLAEAQAVELLEELPPELAADIIEELPADIAGDLLREMGQSEFSGILGEIEDAEDLEDLRERVSYAWDSAGGLMSDQVLSYPISSTVGAVLLDLSEHAEEYSDRDVQYVYVADAAGRLRGVLPLRDLVLTPRSSPVERVMIRDPLTVRVDASVETLHKIFAEHGFLGLPVVDELGQLEGVVSREAVHECMSEHQTEDYMKSAGIISGEELRSMPLRVRCTRRLTWLVPNIVLNLIAASVIAAYEDTLQAVIALAVFLPIVSDMSGCSGNQAVAVSIRELTLGIIQPRDFLRVVFKEGLLGIFNGIVLGIVLGTVAGVWRGNLYLGLVVGGALALNTLLSVLLGGVVPLVLKRLKIDPALAAAPILTTCTDMCGFFAVLSLASLALDRLV